MKKIEGKLFVAKDGDGYIRIFFETKTKEGKVETLTLETICGGGYYNDVTLKKIRRNKWKKQLQKI